MKSEVIFGFQKVGCPGAIHHAEKSGPFVNKSAHKGGFSEQRDAASLPYAFVHTYSGRSHNNLEISGFVLEAFTHTYKQKKTFLYPTIGRTEKMHLNANENMMKTNFSFIRNWFYFYDIRQSFNSRHHIHLHVCGAAVVVGGAIMIDSPFPFISRRFMTYAVLPTQRSTWPMCLEFN